MESARHERNEEKLDWALGLDVMLHAYMFTLSGIPVIYSGDEIAQENDYSYHEDPNKAADSRYLHRGKLNWEKAERRKDPASPEGKLFGALRRLEELRGGHRVFDSEADTWIVETRDDAVLGIGRYYLGEKLVALFNFWEGEKRLCIDELGAFSDLVTGETRNKQNLTMGPGTFLWLICDFKRVGA